MNNRRKIGISIVIPLFLAMSIGVLTLITIACASGERLANSPQFDVPEKGNFKLDSQLNQLIHADIQGESALYAQQHNIELLDNSVRVIIECVPGQLDHATEAAKQTGAKIEATYGNLVQVVVPITSLSALTEIQSIRFVRLPQHPLPLTNKE